MRQRMIGLAAAFVCLSGLCVAGGPQKSGDDVRAKLETAIPEAIRLLEANDHVTFLKTFMAPDDLKALTARAQAPVEEVAKGFAERAGRILTALKAVQGTTPVLAADGGTATFTLKEPVGGRDSISFKKVGGLWYLAN